MAAFSTQTASMSLAQQPLPAADSVSFSSDTGASQTDLVTREKTLAISGVFDSDLQSGDRVEMSFTNGAQWIVVPTSGPRGFSYGPITFGGDNKSVFQVRVVSSDDVAGEVRSFNYTIDTTAPTVTGNIAAPANGSYSAGQTLSFTVTFNENVTVIGTDSSLDLDIGGLAKSAAYASKTTNSVTYTYTIQPGDTDANGIMVGSIALGASTIRDLAGNDAVLSLAGHVPSTAGVLVDTTAPAVSGNVAVPANATYVAGQVLDFTVSFDENVTVSGSDSTLGLTLGASARSAAFLSSSGNTVTYRYTVQAGDLDANGIAVGALSLGASTIRDAAGNNASLSLAGQLPSTVGVLVEGTIPTVSGMVNVPADRVYKTGETLEFTVAFDENVTVTGTASTLGLTVGGVSRSAAYKEKTANSVTYAYTVQAGDNDADGIAVTGIALGGSTIRDGAGNDANLSLTGHLPSTTGVLVDAVAPTVLIETSAGSLNKGQTAEITFTFSEAPTGFTAADVSIDGGSLSDFAGSGLRYTAIFTPDDDVDDGIAEITIAAGSYTDKAGNSGGGGAPPYLTFDTLAPAKPSTPDLLAASDTGPSNSDNLTSDATPTFTGTAEPLATVSLYVGSVLIGSGAAGQNGVWTITPVAAVGLGTHVVTARAVDEAGNISDASSGLSIQIVEAGPQSLNLAAGETLTLTADLTIAGLSGAGDLVLGGHKLTIDQATNSNFSGKISGSGGVDKLGTGVLTLSGVNSFTGPATIKAGALALSGGQALADATTANIEAGGKLTIIASEKMGAVSGAGVLEVAHQGQVLDVTIVSPTIFTGEILGFGSVHKRGSGSLTLKGDFNTGATIHALEGDLVLDWAQPALDLPNLHVGKHDEPAAVGRIVLNQDVTVRYIGGYAATSGVIDLGAHDLTIDFTGDGRSAAEITGSGGVIKRGAGMFRLDGGNTFTGDVKVEGGALRLANGSALADSVAVSVLSGARLTLDTSSGNFEEKIGSIEGAGEIAFNPSNILIAGDASDRAFSGRLFGAGTFKKVGAGELVLSGTSEAGVSLVLSAGDLVIDAEVAGAVTAEGGMLSGTGAITGAVEIKSGATLSAGHSPGVLATGDLKLQADAVLLQELASSAQVDQIKVIGGVDLGGAKLETALLSGFAPTSGSWVIIDNDGTDAVAGHFDGLSEGAQFTKGGVTFKISYAGGTGNDVTLSVVAPPAPEPEEPQPPAPPTEKELFESFLATTGFASTSEKLEAEFIRLANGLQIPNPVYHAARAAEKLSSNFAAGMITKSTFVEGLVELSGPTSAVALQTYHLFTGSAPTAAGLAWLVDSPDNPTDLTDAYYALFNQTNRFINFSVNLGVHGEGKAAFEAAYASLSFEEAVRKAYDTIIGFKEAQAAGIDTEAAVDWVVSQQDYLANFSSGGAASDYAGMLGYLLHEGNVAKVGKYYNAVRAHVERLVDGESLGNSIADFYQDEALPQDLGRPSDWSFI